jgi:hypothetical protein
MKSTSDAISHIQVRLLEVIPASMANAWMGGTFAWPTREGADAPEQKVQSGARH